MKRRDLLQLASAACLPLAQHAAGAANAGKAAKAASAASTASTASAADGASTADLTLQVQPQPASTPLPALWRPSAMLSWADGEAIEALLALPGRLGCVRLTLEELLRSATDAEAYRARLAREAPALQAFARRGATLVVTFARMPRWLASARGHALRGEHGFSAAEASPPNSLAGLSALAEDTVRQLNGVNGLDPCYEFWNEPENPIYWSGNRADYLAAYAAFAQGARRADPRARVGGSGGNRGELHEHATGAERDRPSLHALIAHAGRQRLPLDFVSWHHYPGHPSDGWDGAAQVREALQRAGLPPATPQLVTEWNLWRLFPQWLEPPRDEVQGAAFMLSAMHDMAANDIAGQTFATLQDFRAAPPDSAFSGDFGLLTRAPLLRKAGFHALHMLARLDGLRPLPFSFDGQNPLVQGMDALAVGDAAGQRVLVSRYPAEGQVFSRALRRAGVTRRGQIRADDDKLRAFGKRQAELGPADAEPTVRAALYGARAAAEAARDLKPQPLTLRLRIDGRGERTPWRVYAIGKDSLDPAQAYRAARAAGRSHAQALAAARAQQDFAPSASGRGATVDLQLPAHAVALVEFGDAAG